MSIETKQQEIIDEFSMFEDWMSKYEYIIELGRDLPVMEESLKTEDKLIKGCQSRVWLNSSIDDEGNVVFTADSDAMITKGLISMLVRVLSHEAPEQVATADLHFIADIGLQEHLSPTRSNGLVSMVKQMKLHGLTYSQTTN